MEYFIGSLSTMIVFYFIGKYGNQRIFNRDKIISIKYRQSSMHEMVKHLIPVQSFAKKVLNTQSMKHDKRTNVKVIIVNGCAYWVKDNIFYMANMEDGFIDKETTRLVDTMGMDKVELDKMIFIIDKLTEGADNDHSNSGN